MSKKSFLFFLAVIALGISGCAPVKGDLPKNGPDDILRQLKEEFNLPSLSWLITEKGKLTSTYYSSGDFSGICSRSQNISGIFVMPVLLNRLISDSLVNENDSLDKYFPSMPVSGSRIKDLIALQADNKQSLLSDQDTVTAMMRKIIGAVKKDDGGEDLKKVREHLAGYDHAAGEVGSLFRNLSRVSSFFDEENPMYASVGDSLVANLFPSWYTENTSRFFGWNVFKFQRQTLLWNCFNFRDETLLVMKFMEKDVFISLCYRSENLPGPYDYHKRDLLQSPIALALLRSGLLPSLKARLDYKGSPDSVIQEIKPFEGTPYQILFRKDLIAHARYFQRLGDIPLARRLYEDYDKISGDSLLGKYLNRPVVAETGYIPDNFNEIVPFKVDTDGFYQVFAGGQVLPVSDYNYTPYQYDNVQVFLNSAIAGRPVRNDRTRIFHFNYRFDRIAGPRDERLPDSWLRNTKIHYAFNDPSDTSYILEARIPWQEIDSVSRPGRESIRMNIFIGDSDWEENRRESILSWALKEGEPWDSASAFGLLSFVPGTYGSNRRSYYSRRINKPPAIDGLIDEIWDQADYSDIDLPYQNKVSRFDNSGKFKSLYDYQYLYLLFVINDNCKNRTGIITRDKCWIEDAADGELIWKMPADTSQGLPSCTTEHKIHLKAGRYYLRYLSDGGHSFEGWFARPPVNDIYGGIIYKECTHNH